MKRRANSKRRAVLGMLAATALGPTLSSPALARTWPGQPIRMIIGFPPGGGMDNLGRVLAEHLARTLGQPIIVDNKPGAGGGIATAELLRAPADGHVIALGNVGQFSILEHLAPNPIQDLPSKVAAIGQVGNAPLGLFVPANLPVASASEFIAYVRAAPGKYNYGSGGAGQITHLAVEMFKAEAGLDLTHVPYKGSAASVTDLVGGRIEAIIDALGVGMPYVEAGRLKLLGLTVGDRLADMPGVPTLREAGLPNYVVSGWQGMVAPRGTPKAIIARLNESLNAALTDPGVSEKMRTLGYLPAPGTPEAFASLMRDDSARWSTLIRTAGIELK